MTSNLISQRPSRVSTNGARLTDDGTTGETIIPRGWFEKRYGDRLVGFDQSVENVNQTVVTLRR